MSINKFRIKDYREINYIYKQSFPKEERKPLLLLIFNILLNRAELWCLCEENDICGFIYIINYQNMVFILYLAISNLKRSKGYGTYLLNWCLNSKKGKDIYLNIDKLDEKSNDFEIRKKRLSFYLNNGFYLTDYLSLEKECDFNILTNNKNFNVENYKRLDKRVSQCLFDKKSNIIRKGKI